MNTRKAACLATLASALLWGSAASVAGSGLRPVGFGDLKGWAADDHAAAFTPFRQSCGKSQPDPGARSNLVPWDALKAACADALSLPAHLDERRARAFFEAWFQPHLVEPPQGALLTGYYEPEFAGSLTRTDRFNTPLLAFPASLPPGALPDRAAIEAGALAGAGRELVWLDPVDAFFVHIQGSARIRIGPGHSVRVRFAGRNGHAFTPIGRVLVERGAMTLEEVDMASIRAWLAAHPMEAPALMRENRSYIFFSLDEGRTEREGPIGAQDLPLTAGRSIAVDSALWPYGLPVWVEARIPGDGGEAEMRRLTIAQDTGAAIKGAARADIFIGTGAKAGDIAGRMKHRGSLFVLLPRLPEAAR